MDKNQNANIGFYLTNKLTSHVDCTNVSEGNPGIGGTYYAMLLLADLLTKRGVNIILFAQSVENLPSNISKIKTDNLESLSKKLDELKIDILLVNKIGKNTLDHKFFAAIRNNDINIVIWAHCFIPYTELNYYAKNEKVKRIIAVSKEEMLTWSDHKIFAKANYIFNICEYPLFNIKPYENRNNSVVYIGSIVPLKGLHLLTKAWPTILKEIPDAKLLIIGSGKLYDQNQKLGKYNIAEYFYEKKLLAPIVDKKGKILPSVKFLGVMGKEKFDILNESKVGVPNPSGLSETFGYTAIEMQLSGCKVATIKCPGYLDTVYQPDHILYTDESELAQSVIALLREKRHDPSKSKSFIEAKFSTENILDRWQLLFKEIVNNENSFEYELSSQYSPTINQLKNREWQMKLPFLPSLLFYRTILNTIKYIYLKFFDMPTTLEKIYQRVILKKIFKQ